MDAVIFISARHSFCKRFTYVYGSVLSGQRHRKDDTVENSLDDILRPLVEQLSPMVYHSMSREMSQLLKKEILSRKRKLFYRPNT